KGNAEPAIKGFTLSGASGEDSTAVVLSQPFAVLLFCEDFSTPFSEWKDDFSRLYALVTTKKIPVYVITSRAEEAGKIFGAPPFTSLQIFKCDYTAIRTAARTNPTVYLLKQGAVVEKESRKRMDKILKAVEAIPVQE